MRRLYLQIYVAFLGILLLFGGLVTVASLLLPLHPQEHLLFDGMGAVLSELLPRPERPVHELQAAVEHLRRLLPIDLAVHSAAGARLAAVGPPLPAPLPQHMVPGWMRARGAGPTVALALPDGRFVVARWQRPHHALGLLGALGLLAIAIALGAYPIVRRITRRLERLQTQVEALGAFATDVDVRRLHKTCRAQPQRAVAGRTVNERAGDGTACRQAVAQDFLERQRADQVFDLDVEIVDGEGKARNPTRL